MNLSIFAKHLLHNLKRNSPEILIGVGVSGVATTAYLAGKAGHRARPIIDEYEEHNGEGETPVQKFAERTKLVWKFYIPAGISGAITIAAIVGASKASGRRTAAAITAYSLTERAFSEYREKVIEQLGAGKEQRIRDEIAQDRVNRNPAESREVVVLGGGHVLCCELYTNRYFRSDMETLRKTQNDLNEKIINQLYVPLDEFYDLIGLRHTSVSSNIGWNSDKLMELQFSTVISGDGEPCLAFDYNYTKPLT